MTVNSERAIRVVVGEDEPFVREGILRVLQEGGFDVVGTAADAGDLRRVAEAYQPDVVVADIQMPPDHGDDGLRAALAIRVARPGIGVLVLSQFLEDAYAFALVADGAQGVGYLLKEKVGDLRTRPMSCLTAWRPTSAVSRRREWRSCGTPSAASAAT